MSRSSYKHIPCLSTFSQITSKVPIWIPSLRLSHIKCIQYSLVEVRGTDGGVKLAYEPDKESLFTFVDWFFKLTSIFLTNKPCTTWI